MVTSDVGKSRKFCRAGPELAIDHRLTANPTMLETEHNNPKKKAMRIK
jgi:hypothetical protein